MRNIYLQIYIKQKKPNFSNKNYILVIFLYQTNVISQYLIL